MLYKRTLYKIKDDTGYEFFDDKDQIEYLIHEANFAIDQIKEGTIENQENFKDNFTGILVNILSLIKDSMQYLKYKNDINALKTRIKEIDIKKYLKQFSLEEVMSLMQVLNELCLIEIEDAKSSKQTGKIENNFNQDDIKYFYSDNDLDTIKVSKSAYASARVKNGIKYCAAKVGNKTFTGVAKVLKKYENKDI